MQIPKLEDTYRLRCNVGRTEALLHVFTGLAILGAGVYFRSWLGLIGLMPLLTGLLKWCPLYRLLGVSTCVPPQQMEQVASPFLLHTLQSVRAGP